MTRYEAAMTTLSLWLAKARAPSEESDTQNDVDRDAPISSVTRQELGTATHVTRKLTLPPSWQGHDPSLEHSPVLIRLWRTLGGGRGTGPRE